MCSNIFHLHSIPTLTTSVIFRQHLHILSSKPVALLMSRSCTLCKTASPAMRLISCRCARCGMAFTLPQEVSRHVREGICMFRPEENTSDIQSEGEQVPKNSAVSSTSTDISSKDEEGGDNRSMTCSRCSYRTESRAELLFHEVLHGEPITDSSVVEDPSDVQVGHGTVITPSQVMHLFTCMSLVCCNSV